VQIDGTIDHGWLLLLESPVCAGRYLFLWSASYHALGGSQPLHHHLAPVVTRNEPLGVAICPNTPPQKADPSGQGLLNRGAERSEALAAGGGGAPPGFAGVGPRETN